MTIAWRAAGAYAFGMGASEGPWRGRGEEVNPFAPPAEPVAPDEPVKLRPVVFEEAFGDKYFWRIVAALAVGLWALGWFGLPHLHWLPTVAMVGYCAYRWAGERRDER
ncbi:MAG TPA: hypothetical protein VFZ53_16480 [Polyangiaceae bacterium]